MDCYNGGDGGDIVPLVIMVMKLMVKELVHMCTRILDKCLCSALEVYSWVSVSSPACACVWLPLLREASSVHTAQEKTSGRRQFPGWSGNLPVWRPHLIPRKFCLLMPTLDEGVNSTVPKYSKYEREQNNNWHQSRTVQKCFHETLKI